MSPTRRALRALRARWASVGANDGWLASRYFELIRANADGTSMAVTSLVDDRTWNDLEFPRIFATLDTAVTRLGSQCLYRRLRTCLGDPDSASDEYASLQTLRSNRRLREKIQLSLAGLRADSCAYLCDHLFGKPLSNPTHRVWIVLWCPVSIAVLAAVLASALSPLALVALLAVNVGIIYWAAPRLHILVENLRGLCDLVSVAERLARVRAVERIPQLAALVTAADIRVRARRSLRAFAFFRDAPFGIGTWLNLLCLAEWVAYIHTVDRVNSLRDGLRALFELVGSLDATIAVASFIERVDSHCVPEFSPDGSIDIEDGYHPLLRQPTRNSARLERSALISGSNMAGKTTFIKMVGINIILGRTLGICLAARAVIPRAAAVMACIRAEHSTESGKSRYFAEMEALLSFLRVADEGRPTVLVIDEPFSGTNTVERIAAAKAVLTALSRRAIVLATTHDIELQTLLAETFDLYHFREDPDVEGFFDYRLRPGPCTEGNALRLLGKIGFPPDVVRDAMALVPTRSGARSRAEDHCSSSVIPRAPAS